MESQNRALKDRINELSERYSSPDGTEKRLLSISAIRTIAGQFEIPVGQAEILPPLIAAWAPHTLFLALAGYITAGLRT